MKTVFTNSMVAHVWAQQAQSEGRNGKNSFYFRDSTIYSWGGHFPIARFVTREDGQRCVLFTIADYSVSTSDHKAEARRAIRGTVPVFYVAHVEDAQHMRHDDNWESYKNRVQHVTCQAIRARTNGEFIIRRANELHAEANAYAAWFGLPQRLPAPKFTKEFLSTIKQRAAERKAQADERARADAILRAAELSERVLKWRRGEHGSCVGTPCMLRVKGDMVQTSQGAEVPVSHAKRLWKVIQRVMQSGKPYEKNGHTEHVGQFTVDAIDTAGNIRAGCHSIAYAEVSRLAVTLGLVKGVQS